jgi:hypothetical protein
MRDTECRQIHDIVILLLHYQRRHPVRHLGPLVIPISINNNVTNHQHLQEHYRPKIDIRNIITHNNGVRTFLFCESFSFNVCILFDRCTYGVERNLRCGVSDLSGGIALYKLEEGVAYYMGSK